MFWTIRFWLRDHYQAWVVKQFKKLPDSIKYRYVSDYLYHQAKNGKGHYFKCLIDSFENPI